MSPVKSTGIEKKDQTLTEETELVWTEVSDLEVGEAFTLGEHCPLTFIVREKFVGRTGRVEVDTTVLAGLSNGRAYGKTMYRPALEVLIVPDEHVGRRISGALTAFQNRNRRGSDRVELGADVWPHTATAAEEAEVSA